MKFRQKSAITQLTLLCVIVMCALLISVSNGYAQTQNEARPQTSGTHVVTGKLVDYYGPIVTSAVFLNSIKDEDCAKFFQASLFDRGKDSETNRKKLEACVTDVGPVEPNAEGIYTFSNLSPGYYALVVSWNTREKFKRKIFAFRKGDFVITYYEGAKYNAVSTGRPFYFSRTETVTKDFDFTKGVITNETSF